MVSSSGQRISHSSSSAVLTHSGEPRRTYGEAEGTPVSSSMFSDNYILASGPPGHDQMLLLIASMISASSISWSPRRRATGYRKCCSSPRRSGSTDSRPGRTAAAASPHSPSRPKSTATTPLRIGAPACLSSARPSSVVTLGSRPLCSGPLAARPANRAGLVDTDHVLAAGLRLRPACFFVAVWRLGRFGLLLGVGGGVSPCLGGVEGLGDDGVDDAVAVGGRDIGGGGGGEL
jgi:hypothetical protein